MQKKNILFQNEPLFLRTYTDAEGEEEEDANLRLHNIVHSSLDVVGERKGEGASGDFGHYSLPLSVSLYLYSSLLTCAAGDFAEYCLPLSLSRY